MIGSGRALPPIPVNASFIQPANKDRSWRMHRGRLNPRTGFAAALRDIRHPPLALAPSSPALQPKVHSRPSGPPGCSKPGHQWMSAVLARPIITRYRAAASDRNPSCGDGLDGGVQQSRTDTGAFRLQSKARKLRSASRTATSICALLPNMLAVHTSVSSATTCTCSPVSRSEHYSDRVTCRHW